MARIRPESLNLIARDNSGSVVERWATIDQDQCNINIGKCSRTQEEAAHLRHDVSVAVSALPRGLRELAELLKEHSTSDVARIQGCSRYQIYRRIEVIREHFRRRGLDGYRNVRRP